MSSRTSNKRKEYRKSFGVISPPPLARSSERSVTDSMSIISKPTDLSRPAVLSSPMRKERHSNHHEAGNAADQSSQVIQYSLTDMVSWLRDSKQQMDRDQDELTTYKLQEAFQGIKAAPDRRVQTGDDLFAGCRKPPLADEQEDTMCVEVRHQVKGKQVKQVQHHLPILCDTETESVPDYMYRYVSIAKTLLAPASDQAQISQNFDFKTRKDKEDFETRVAEIKDNNTVLWNSEPLRKQQIFDLTVQLERSHAVAAYLQAWLEDLKIPASALVGSQSSSQGSRPAQAASVNPSLLDITVKFKKAFDEVFCSSSSTGRRLSLDRVVQLAHLDTSETNSPKDIDEQTNAFLLSYCFQGCLICHQYACEHGEFNSHNLRERIRFPDVPELLAQRRQNRGDLGRHRTAATKLCVCQMPTAPQRNAGKPWTAEEGKILMMTAITSEDHMNMKVDPACIAAATLSRSCEEVRQKLHGMNLSRPEPKPTHLLAPKPLPFYDRKKKRLLGDWNKKLMSHRYAERRLVDRGGCHHEGPCTVESCQCRQLKLLCEKYCRCTESSCAAKFTGCGCKAADRNCIDGKCICIQLERECDPDLCGSCGVGEQCDPWRHPRSDAKDKRCFNCDLQTARPKATVKADSEIEGAGFGLLIAEAASKGDFVIEYVGEWEPYDEGERRTIRRDNADMDFNAPSYLFTVLHEEAIEIDSAAYGNMSRFANSGTVSNRPGAKQTANIVPQIVYVNGEFRIKLVATRDIKVGEELFFSYGSEYFGKGKQTTKPKKSVSEADKRIAKARAPIQRMTAVPDMDAGIDAERDKGTQSNEQRDTPESSPYRDSESGNNTDSEGGSDDVASEKDVNNDRDESGHSGPASAPRPGRLDALFSNKEISALRGRSRRRDSGEDLESERPKKQQRTNTYGIPLRTIPASWATTTPPSQARRSQEQHKTGSSVRSERVVVKMVDSDGLTPVVKDSQEDDGEEVEGQSSQVLDDGEDGEDDEGEEDEEESEEDATPSQMRRQPQRSRRRPRRFKSVAFDEIRK